jgi:hypothetical protein
MRQIREKIQQVREIPEEIDKEETDIENLIPLHSSGPNAPEYEQAPPVRETYADYLKRIEKEKGSPEKKEVIEPCGDPHDCVGCDLCGEEVATDVQAESVPGDDEEEELAPATDASDAAPADAPVAGASRRLLSKAELGLVSIAPRDESRYHLNRVHVTNAYSEATDGHCLMRVFKDGMDPADYPSEGLPGHEFTGDINVVIPVASLANIKLPKKNALPILGYACVSSNDKDIYVSTNDLQAINNVTVPERAQEGTYPETDQVIPKYGDDAIKFGIDARLLTRVVDFATKFGSKRSVGMLWTIPKDYDGTSPIQITFKTDEDQDVLARKEEGHGSMGKTMGG